MFENTKKALEVFQNAIECAQCKQPKKDLQYLGTSCKHAHCWDCIAEFNKKQPGRRSSARTQCSTCAFPLDTTKIVGAHVLNTCFDTLTELKALLEQARSAPMTQAELACTQRIFDDPVEETSFGKQKAVERFLETQGHMPDEIGQPEEEEEEKNIDNRRAFRENSGSPELDIYHDYEPPAKRSSVKRPSTSVFGDDLPETKPKKTSILKNSNKSSKENAILDVPNSLIFSQVMQKPKVEDLTPFVNRRSTVPTASTTGLVGMYAEPFRSKSMTIKKEEPEDDPFSKKIVLTKRQASLQYKDVKKEISPDPEEEPTSSRPRRSSIRFEAVSERRSQSPMSFGEKSMSTKTEQRRSSFGTRRGEVVIINSILNNRIPQLRSAVEAGTCVNEKDNTGKTPLFVAVEQNLLEAVEILVEAGAVINACCGSTYETTLHEAVRRKNLEIIEYLLSKGASMKIRNSVGKTAQDLAKNEPKIKKILEKFKNEHVLQPVIPPPKSKIHFVQLIDEKLLSDAEKKKLPGKINIVPSDMDTPTHVVVPVDLKTKTLIVTKEHLAGVLKAIIGSGMIVSREWLKVCMINASKVDEDRMYAVKKLQWMDGPVIENSIDEWKRTITKMQPKLFAGCKFYFPKAKYTFLDRVNLIEIVRSAGGQASARGEPVVNDKEPAPYHNSSLKTNFIVYSLTHDIAEKFRDCTKYNLVCEQWLIEAILSCSIKSPPY